MVSNKLFTINTFNRFSVYLILFMIALLSFHLNFFGFADKNFYNNFQLDSEALVIGSISATKQKIDKQDSGLGFLDATTYKKYISSYGLQGRLFSNILNFNIFKSPKAIEYLKFISAALTALCLTLLTIIYSKILNPIYGTIFFIVEVSSPWVISMGPNLYWIPWLWLSPVIVLAIVQLRFNLRFSKNILLLLIYFLLILCRCLSGYEFLSSEILWATSIFLVAPLFHQRKISSKEWNYFCITTCLSIIAFCVALLIHASIRDENLILGLKEIFIKDALRRTYGDPLNYDHLFTLSLTSNPITVINTYIHDWNTSIFFFIPGAIYQYLLLFLVSVFFYNIFSRQLR